ncbi:membrane protein insertion efficiency factor YidD [Modestobacter sp. URMC 112]
MTIRPRGPVARALLACVGFYQHAVSPVLPPRCRFQPTCSAYAVEALEAHGAARGSWLALRRLAKCAPWHPGGVDLVPPSHASVPAGPAGTPDPVRSSSTAAPDLPEAPHRAPRPAPGRTPPQEAGVV